MIKNENEQQIDTVGSTLLEFLTIIAKRRWFLIIFVSIVTICVTTFALLSDRWYKATTSVFPSTKTDLLGGLGGLSSLVNGFSSSGGISALTGNPELDRYVAILKSARVVDTVINKYNYRNLYDFDADTYYEKIKEEFESNVEIEIQDEGNLTVSFYDKNPQRAADVANFMINLVNKISTELNVKDAKYNREFIEKRYQQNLVDINRLEETMQKFQEQYGVVELPEQLKQTVKTMSEVYSKKTEKEIQYNVMRRTYGKNYPLTKKAHIEVDEFNKKIKKIISGKENLQNEVKLLIPFKQAPDLGNKYLKIYRNLEIQYKILEFITPLYEQAKVEEVRNTPSVTVLDKAVAPERKAKPKGSFYALISFVLSLIVGFFIISIREWVERLRKTNIQKFEYFHKLIKSDIQKITFSKKK